MRNAPVPETWPIHGANGRAMDLDLVSLTSIFKGGSRTDEIDVGRPFRASSIRGALRFWWRATSPIPDVGTLRDREKEIFGGVHGGGPVASAVSVAVLRQASAPGPRPMDKPYAFGVTGRDPVGEASGKQVHKNASGRLHIEWRDATVGDDVERALRAWLLCGGIGGRSRRGAGSVWWGGEGSAAPSNAREYVRMVLDLTPRRLGEPRWPTLAGGALLVGPAFDTADDAWSEGLNGMRDVRASRDVRTSFVPRRGPDLLEWKRADYLKFGQGAFRSPRAALGLPIRFQGTKGRFDLTPQGQNRFPSPVHLKVARLGSKYHPVYAVLRGPTPTRLTATNGGGQGTVDDKGVDRFLELAAQLHGWSRHDLGGVR